MLGTDLPGSPPKPSSFSQKLIHMDYSLSPWGALSPWVSNADVLTPPIVGKTPGSADASIAERSSVPDTITHARSLAIAQRGGAAGWPGSGRDAPASGASTSERPAGLPAKPWEKAGFDSHKATRAAICTPYSDRSEGSAGGAGTGHHGGQGAVLARPEKARGKRIRGAMS